MSNLDSLAIHLIRAGQWSEAIHLYRDEMGLSIPQAEQIVLGLADDYGLKHPQRLMTWVAIAFGGFSLFALASVLQMILSA
jgi:hypothetical protein